MKGYINKLTDNLKYSLKYSVTTIVKQKVAEKVNEVKEDLTKKKQQLITEAQKQADALIADTGGIRSKRNW